MLYCTQERDQNGEKSQNSFMWNFVEEIEIFESESLGNMIAIFKKENLKGFKCEEEIRLFSMTAGSKSKTSTNSFYKPTKIEISP